MIEDPEIRTFDRSTSMTDYERLGTDETEAKPPAKPQLITEISVVSVL